MTWALAATLIGTILASNGALVVHEMADALEAQSRDETPPRPWFADFAIGISIAAMVMFATGTGAPFYGWAKFRTASRSPAPEAEAEEEEDRPLAPPGFAAGPVRTRRVGLAPLMAWSAVGVVVLAAGAALAGAALVTLQQTATFDGRGFRAAVLWGQLLRFAALPLVAIGAATVGLAWGRWFPLGALEKVEQASPRPSTSFRWDRQG